MRPTPRLRSITVLYTFGALALRFVLGSSAPAADVASGSAGRRCCSTCCSRCRCTRSSAACCRRASSPTACTRCGSLASRPRSLAPLPALRPARRGALSAHAAARVSRRRSSASSRSRSSPSCSCGSGRCRCSPATRTRTQASDNRVRDRRVDAPRGAIIDRNGRVLVAQRPGHEHRGVAGRPAQEPRRARARAAPPRDGRRHAPCESSRRASEPARTTRSRRWSSAAASTTTRSTTSRSTSAQLPGVELVDTYLRKYPHRSLGAHILGHVGEISPEQVKAMKRDGYRAGDWIGQAGVESTYDTYLRGRAGLGAVHRRLARPADEPAAAERGPEPGEHGQAHDRPRAPACGRAGASRRDRVRAGGRRHRVGRERRRGRRARPTRRVGARARLVSDVRALGLRQPGPAQDGAAPERRQGA